MKIVLPYTRLAPGVLDALAATEYAYELHDVSGDEQAYWRLLRDLWAAGETFAVVEHDVLVRPDTLAELAACERVWCSFPVPYLSGEHLGLACTKFAAELIRVAPKALIEAGEMHDEQHPPKSWCRLDAWLCQRVLPGTGIARHAHGPALGHYRDGGPAIPRPTHGCC